MTKKFVPPYVKHRDCPIEIRTAMGHNNAIYYCVKCRVWVGWLNKDEAQAARDLNLIKITPL